MIGLRITFDLGRYHATPWGSNVNDATVEWPPSPWRLLRGLYSVGRTHAGLVPRQADLDRALTALASAPPPVFELPPAAPAHTRHYMPVLDGRSEKSAKILDGFLAVDPGGELVAWWDVNLDADASDALAAAARALGYVGRSESVCSARMEAGSGPARPTAVPVPEVAADSAPGGETIDLLCADADDPLAALSVGVTELRAQRWLVPPGTRWVTYLVARANGNEGARSGMQDAGRARPNLALFRVRGGDRPSVFDAVKMGQLLRSSLQSRFGNLAEGASSPTFSGKAGDTRRTDQHQHAHYLSLPDDHGRRIDRLLVWAPEGLGAEEVAALAGLRELVFRDPARNTREEFQLALGALGAEGELRLPLLLGPARDWESLTPFALVRHPKVKRGEVVDPPEEQVRRELLHRGFPEPAEIIQKRGEWHRFRSSRLGTSRLGRAPVLGVKIRFAEEVDGPIAIGAHSHYGLGLMTPARPA